jgi:uncharacterized repeat protein (TIGR03847 family)
VEASYEMSSPERFTAGTVGEPGHRVFFIQALAEGELVSLKCEKQQVGALAEHLAGLLADLPVPPEEELSATDIAFVEPPGPDWIVGRMGVAWDERSDRMVLLCEQLLAEEEQGPDDAPASARFRLTRAQVAAFVELARDLVVAGRPPCYLCGGPMDPDGHDCPRWN